MTQSTDHPALPAGPDPVRFALNGWSVRYEGDPDRMLLDWLREDAALTSLKRGCAPQGACGACCVSIDGAPQLACTFKMRRAHGRDIRTLEGLDQAWVSRLAAAIARHGAAQCGFCTPGIVLRATLMLGGGARPSRQEVAAALDPHMCRCTGWVKVLDAIVDAANPQASGGQSRPHSAAIGARLDKRDAHALALGRRAFVGDLSLPGMLHGAMVLSDHARARLRGIDPGAAMAVPGVVAVLTAQDVPGQRHVGLLVADWPVFVAVGETTACVGDCLALVVAEDRATARRAAALVRVDCEVLAPVTDPLSALAADAPAVHPGGNLLHTTRLVRGDVDAALARAAHVVRRRYTTQRVEHAFLEPECALAAPLEGGGVQIHSQSQGVYEDRRQIAALLGLPERLVRVTLVPSGGAFGGKEDLSVQGQAAVAAWALQRPVRVELSRDESIRLHPKRHPYVMDWELGCDDRGRLLGLRARIVGDTGGHASVGAKVLQRSAAHAAGAYDVPAVDVEARAVYTHNPPSGAFRGFGVNQVHFAMESAVDELCELGGFDRWQMRWDNALREGSPIATGQVLGPGVGVRACLEAVRGAFEAGPWTGLAAGMKNTGVGNGAVDEGRVRIEVLGPERVRIHHGFTDMGQGVDTIAQQFLTERTGLVPRQIEVVVDTDAELPTGMTTASRATSLLGHAMLDAADRLAADLAQHPLAELVGRQYQGQWRCDWTTGPDGGEAGVVTHYSFAWAAQVVQVDKNGRVVRVTAAHDVGRLINPKLFEGQIEGAVHMGLGYALTEELPCDEDGWPLSTRLRDCGVIPASKTPPVTVIAVQTPDPHGPLGARGVGEIGLVPTAPAVAAALWRLDGRRRLSLPMRPPRRRKRPRPVREP